MEGLRLFVPIRKVDEAKRLVYGVAAQEVPDRADEIMDYASAKPEFAKWSAEMSKATDGKSVGNLRAMHGKIAAGRLDALNFNDTDKAIEVVAKVVDDDEWKKVAEGVYTGFSMGGRYLKRWADPENATLTRYTPEPQEISLVDRPCIPTATFDVVKMDGAIEKRAFKVDAAAAPTNDEVAAKAQKMAEAAGDAKSWAKFIEPARAELTKAHEKSAAEKAEKAAGVDYARYEKEWDQVWLCKRDGKTFKAKEDLVAHMKALDAEEAAKAADPSGADILARLDALGEKLTKKDYSDEERKAMAGTGEAMSDGSYPIKSSHDVANAVKDWNRSGQSQDVRKHILRRATELGALDKVPDDWRGDTSASAGPARSSGKTVGADLAKDGASIDHAAVHASMARFHAQNAAGENGEAHKRAAAAHADAFMAHATGANDAAAKSDAAFGETCKCWGMGKAAGDAFRNACKKVAILPAAGSLAKWLSEVFDASQAMDALRTVGWVLESEQMEPEDEPPEQIAALKAAIAALKAFIVSEIQEDHTKAAGGEMEKAGARNSKADLAKIQQAHDALVGLGATCVGGKDRPVKHVHADDLTKAEAERDGALAKVASLEATMAQIAERLKKLEDTPLPLPIANAARSVQKADDSAALDQNASSLEKMMETPEGRQAISHELIKAAQRNPRILGVAPAR